MKKIPAKLKACFPIWAVIFLAIALVALTVEVLSRSCEGLADGINDTSGVVIRTILTTLTSWIPFSLAETALLLSPALLLWIVISMIRRGKKGWTHAVRYFVGFLSVLSLVYAVFVFGYGTGYYGKTIDEKLGMQREKVSAEELYETAMILASKAEAELDHVTFPDMANSSMTFSYAEMSKKLNAAYDNLCDRYPVFQRLHSSVKPVALSEPWTYTHLSGVYCFFSGEANINTNYPDFIVISSAAHEMAHQRGICREDEANFVSFLVCTMSDDAYVRYCGYIDALETVMSKLYSANIDYYRSFSASMPSEILGEYQAYCEFFEEYNESKAAEVSRAVNGAYIEVHGQSAGIKSYDLVTDLVVSYLLYGDTYGEKGQTNE